MITHGPSFGILDLTDDKINIGCKELKKIVDLKKPKVHIFGHVHHSYGQTELNGTRFYNVSILDEAYQLKNEPTYI